MVIRSRSDFSLFSTRAFVSIKSRVDDRSYHLGCIISSSAADPYDSERFIFDSFLAFSPIILFSPIFRYYFVNRKNR